MAYTELLFDICQQLGIYYCAATPKERYFVEEVTRVTRAKQQEEKSGIPQNIRPAFSALTHILTHTGNLPQNDRTTRRESSSPLGGSMLFPKYSFITYNNVKLNDSRTVKS